MATNYHINSNPYSNNKNNNNNKNNKINHNFLSTGKSIMVDKFSKTNFKYRAHIKSEKVSC